MGNVGVGVMLPTATHRRVRLLVGPGFGLETFTVACGWMLIERAERTHRLLLLVLSHTNNSSCCLPTLRNLCVSSVSVEIVVVASNLFL